MKAKDVKIKSESIRRAGWGFNTKLYVAGMSATFATFGSARYHVVG